MSVTAKISEKGQLVIPKEIRDRVNLQKGDTVNVTETDGIITIKKAKTIFDMVGSIKVSKKFDAEKVLKHAQTEITRDKLRRN